LATKVELAENYRINWTLKKLRHPMGILEILFKSKPKDVSFEVVERKICLDKPVSGIWIRVKGTELNALDFFELSTKNKDQSFSRFYLTQGDPIKTHFAPSLDQAISWFKGKSAPRDSYGNIFWGDYVEYSCKRCKVKKKFPLKITKVENIVLFRQFPDERELIGWRIIEVRNSVLGTGVPTKYISLKTIPIIKWDSDKKQYLCQKCATELTNICSEQELDDYVIFSMN
jgi:hypothetical protein